MAEPATTGLAGPARPAVAGAGCLAGLTGLSGEIFNGYKMISKIKDVLNASEIMCKPLRRRDCTFNSSATEIENPINREMSLSISSTSALVLGAPIQNPQDFRQVKPAGATSWVWNHFRVYDAKHNRKSSAICNICYTKATKDAAGERIEGNPLSWEIAYGTSRSTSKLTNHIMFNHGEIYEGQTTLKAVTSVAAGGSMESHVVYGELLYHYCVIQNSRNHMTFVLCANCYLFSFTGGDFMKAYLKWMTSRYLPLDTCDDKFFRAMCAAYSSKGGDLCSSTVLQVSRLIWLVLSYNRI